jgi:hypothetical protein
MNKENEAPNIVQLSAILRENVQPDSEPLVANDQIKELIKETEKAQTEILQLKQVEEESLRMVVKL